MLDLLGSRVYTKDFKYCVPTGAIRLSHFFPQGVLNMGASHLFSKRAAQSALLSLLHRKLSITEVEDFCSYIILQSFVEAPNTEELPARACRLGNWLWAQAKQNHTLLAFLQQMPSVRLNISLRHAIRFVPLPLKPELSQCSNTGTVFLLLRRKKGCIF